MDNLNWDVNGGKYTLRIRSADRRPMIAVGLITFRGKDNTIVVINTVTGNQEEFKLVINEGSGNLKEFLDFIGVYAQKLREEASYQ